MDSRASTQATDHPVGAAEDPAGAREDGGPSVDMTRLEHSVENAQPNPFEILNPEPNPMIKRGGYYIGIPFKLQRHCRSVYNLPSQ